MITQNCRFCFTSQDNCTRKNISQQVKSSMKPSITPIPITISGVILCSIFHMMKCQCIVKKQNNENTQLLLYMNGMLYENKLNIQVQKNGLNINIYNNGCITGSFVYHQSPFKKMKANAPKSELIHDSDSDSVLSLKIYAN